jgi:DNA-binding SARP family transcriptional activator
MTRRHLAGTLWPDVSDAHASASLRSVVSRLEGPARQAILLTAAELSLREGVIVDLWHVRALAHRILDRQDGSIEIDMDAAAVLSLSADLLPGWYDDWAVSAAEEWRQLRVDALEEAAERLMAAGRWAAAANAAQAAVRAEPLRETARAALMKVHLGQGNQAEAVKVFERYRAVLWEELAPSLASGVGGRWVDRGRSIRVEGSLAVLGISGLRPRILRSWLGPISLYSLGSSAE